MWLLLGLELSRESPGVEVVGTGPWSGVAGPHPEIASPRATVLNPGDIATPHRGQMSGRVFGWHSWGKARVLLEPARGRPSP